MSIAEAVERSKELLVSASTPWGFLASPSFDHYAVIWARDALITSIGALRSGEASLTAAAGATIETLIAHRSRRGQIPAVVNPERSEWDFGEGGVVDATAWLAIAAGAFLDATGDSGRMKNWWPAVRDGIEWLAHQDVTGSGLVSAAPSTDWMDAALTRSGRTLHLNVLYAWAIRSATRIAEVIGQEFEPPVADIDRRVNAWFWPTHDTPFDDLHPTGFAHTALATEYRRLAAEDRTHYVSHIVHAAFVDRLDVLANCLAIVGGVADPARTERILESIEPSSRPWPSSTFPAAIPRDDPSGMLIAAIDTVIDPRWSNMPDRYHNGAAWPYVGGFHAAATAIGTGPRAAIPILERVAEANALGDWRFSEWIGHDGPGGAPQQTWNAGTFLYAWSMVEP